MNTAVQLFKNLLHYPKFYVSKEIIKMFCSSTELVMDNIFGSWNHLFSFRLVQYGVGTETSGPCWRRYYS